MKENVCFLCACGSSLNVLRGELQSTVISVYNYVIDDTTEYIRKKYKLDSDYRDALEYYIIGGANCECFFYETGQTAVICISNCFNPLNIDRLIANCYKPLAEIELFSFSVSDNFIVIKKYTNINGTVKTTTCFQIDPEGLTQYDEISLDLLFDPLLKDRLTKSNYEFDPEKAWNILTRYSLFDIDVSYNRIKKKKDNKFIYKVKM